MKKAIILSTSLFLLLFLSSNHNIKFSSPEYQEGYIEFIPYKTELRDKGKERLESYGEWLKKFEDSIYFIIKIFNFRVAINR